MKSYGLIVLVTVIFSLVNISLYAKPLVYPDWFDDDGLEKKFPSKDFIREKGEGTTRQTAENDAVSYISRYFETETNISSVSSFAAVQINGKSDITETLNVRNEITSNMKLFGLKFTEPFYLKKEKKYYCVAYIDRKDAWTRYESEIRTERDIFISYYEISMKEVEPINRIKLLGDAQSAGKTFREKLVFANTLSKDLTQKAYGKDVQLLSSIPSIIKKEQVSNPIYIIVDDDNAGVIENSIRKTITRMGFVETKIYSNSAYIAKTEVNYNKMSGTKRIVLNPYISLSLKGKNGPVYAFSAECGKVVAPNEPAAKKIAVQDIAEMINQKLEIDIKNTLGL